ncbi:MAG: hypothetical protein AAB477_02395 [Patescibacteria group bacterium]
MPEGESRNRIEDIKRRLYDRVDTVSSRTHEGVLHPVVHKVPESWQTNLNNENDITNKIMKKPPTSGFKKFFIGAVIFFLGSLIFATYMFLNGGVSVSSDNIDITVLGNAFTKGGEELPLQVEIVNNNNANLELADLIVEYPRGASDNTTDMIRLPRDTIGVIKKGSRVTRNIKVKLFGEEKSIRNVKITLEYHPEGSNAIFSKDKEYPVTISSAPLSLVIDAPETATSDQDISFKVTASLNTSLPQGATMLQVSYPNNFVFDSAVPIPSFGNSVWNLSGLTQTNPISIVVKGRLVGADGDEQVFHVYAGATSGADQSVVNVVYNSLLKSIIITKPFLEARILVNSQDLPSYVATGGDTVDAQISWSNNLPTRITDTQIIVNFSGNAFDKSTVNPLEGFYDSANNQIIWDKNTISDLASVEPGATGTLSFSFKPISLVGLTNPIKEPQVVLNVSIRGRQPSEGSNFNNVNNFTKKIVKIKSDFQIASAARFTSGSLPPKAETETTYTVTWTLSNSANSVVGAIAHSTLPIYVKWVSPASENRENVVYNEVTREVIWNIGQVRPNTGLDSNREASFVISLKPSLSQVGSVPQLMKEVILSGTDAFTGTIVKNTRSPITTYLISDPGFKSGQERVIQ